MKLFFIKWLTVISYLGNIRIMFTFAHSFDQGHGRSTRMAHSLHACASGTWCAAHIERASKATSITVNPRMGEAQSKLLGMGLDARTNSGRVLI